MHVSAGEVWTFLAMPGAFDVPMSVRAWTLDWWSNRTGVVCSAAILLETIFPRQVVRLDRDTWRGSGDVACVGSARSLDEEQVNFALSCHRTMLHPARHDKQITRTKHHIAAA